MSALIAYAGNEKPMPRVGQFHSKAARLLELWDAGVDTFDIAKKCRCSEAYVHRELIRLRAERRAVA